MKLITGNGVIDGDRKNIGRIVFEPYTQITVDSNSMPRINDRSIGWEERLAKINLPYLFLEALVAGDPQVKVADPDLFKKLTSPDELSGILNLIIYRCKEICRTKRITKRPGKEMIKEYAEQSSSIDTFLKEFCEYEATASNLLQPFAPIFAAFENWCQLTVSEKVDEGYFGKQLKKLCGNMPPKKTKDKERNNVNLYRGLIFDEIKYKATIKKLQDGFKEENVYSVPSVSIGMSTEEKSPLITMSTVSIVNQWNEILKRFSIPFISYIGKETPDLVQTLQTLQTSATGDIEEVPKTVSIVNQEIETPVDKSGAPGLDGINLDEIGECKDASIPDEPTLTPVGGRVPDIATPSVVKSEHDKFMSEVRKHATRQQKRTCHICGLEADHDLIRDDSSRDNVNCYICTTCLISHRVKSKAQGEVPAASSPQTSLSDVALVT